MVSRSWEPQPLRYDEGMLLLGDTGALNIEK